MTNLIARLYVACIVMLLMVTPAGAAELLCSADYPARILLDGSPFPQSNVAAGLLTRGVQSYYRVTGNWPMSWSDVTAAGLVQVPLRDYKMDIIDPADPTLDSWGDLRLVLSADADPTYSTWASSQNSKPLEFRIDKPGQTYAESFAKPNMPDAVRQIADDPMRVAQVGLAIAISNELFWYRAQLGVYPANWQQFIESGFSPVGFDAVNPLNGKPIRMDGGPDDFAFIIGDQQTYVLATDAQGGRPWNIK